MTHFSKYHYSSLVGLLLLPCVAQAQKNDAAKEPPPCAVSILALGQLNPQRLTNPRDYLARYSGISEDADKTCHDMIRTGKESPMPIPALPSELPPGPLRVFLDHKARKAMEFSLNIGGVSKRFAVRRGENLDIYLAKPGPSSAMPTEGKNRKIHSLPIAATCEEMLVFFIKPPTLSWKDYRVVPVDFSPRVVPARSVLLVNFSKRSLLVRPDSGDSTAMSGQLLKPGSHLLYKIPETLETLRLLYADPATPEKTLCSVNCEALPDQRTLAFTYGLGIPENGIDVASRSLQFPIGPVKAESLQGTKEVPADDPTIAE